MSTVSWNALKTFVDQRNLSIQYIEVDTHYELFAIDGPLILNCKLIKNISSDADVPDFEQNYKTNGNKKLDPTTRDSDGSPLSRVKTTISGWHYQLHGIEFESAKLDSIYSKKADGTDYGFSTLLFYESVNGVDTLITGENLNQTYLDTYCIKTVINWEPTHDIEIIGGMLKQSAVPLEDVRLWVVGVPDISEVNGGSKPFVANINLKFAGSEEGIKVDGRSPKYLQYNATYHTTKMQLILRHSAGFKHKVHMVFELFKA